VQPPLRRAALRTKSDLDRRDEIVTSQQESIGERVLLSLELSELSRDAGEALGAAWVVGVDDIAAKAALLARPLRLLASR
jgi:hypothetical protein